MVAGAISLSGRGVASPAASALLYLPVIVLVLQHRSCAGVRVHERAVWFYFRSGRRQTIQLAQRRHGDHRRDFCALWLVFVIAGDSLFNMLQDSVLETTRRSQHPRLACCRLAGVTLPARVQAGVGVWISASHLGAGFRRHRGRAMGSGAAR